MTSKLTDDELTETLRLATSGYPLPTCVEGNLRQAFAELQERRKADSDPVAWTDEEELRDVNVAGIGYLFGIDREANKFADPRRQIMLYRHAQQPVVPDEMDRIGAFDMFDSLPDGDVVDCVQYTWNACRAAMLHAGNSPAIPDGYVMVPKEPTQAMCAAFNDSDYGRKSLRERYVAMLAAAPQEVK
ncbi:hypothetical protein [Klebsiella pneumoniae]|uniref:hypothetical protein n=1 Tax=Klebsiella pneumoniae TaxID=573 RepID=UPI00080900AF|nr:hypothetical protein [Klebsiella pneumoniae]SBW97604.1 Uncharacterised protein [Klebsiella pneumoniae]